jgi:dATP pyrophosphohydrolase
VHATDAGALLLRRSQPFAFWQSVTGSLEPGETPLLAARRELEEETGLRDEGELVDAGICRQFVIDPRWRDRYPPGVTENLEHEWHYRLTNRPAIRLDEAEHSASRWVPLSDAAGMVWSWTNRQALENLAAAAT